MKDRKDNKVVTFLAKIQKLRLWMVKTTTVQIFWMVKTTSLQIYFDSYVLSKRFG